MTALCRSWTFTLTVSLLVLLLGLPLGHRAFAQDDTVVVDRVASGNSSGIVKLGSEGQGKSPRDLSADDWPYNRGMFRHMEPNSSGWPRLPSEAEIKAAADANILAKKQGFTYPGFVNASGGCGFYAPDWAGTYAIHRPGDPSSNAVYLFVSAVLRQTDDCDSSKLDQRGYKTFAWGSARNLWLTRLQYRDGWRFIDMYDDGGLMITAGNVDKNGVQKLMGQFRDDMASRGFVEGLSEGGSAPGDSGESPGSTAAGPATSLPGAIWSAPPAGFSGIGDVPGPRTLGEAAAGVAIPAVVIILVNTLAGLPGGGGAPSPVSVPPPAGPPPIDEEAERRARQLKQDEDDLRRVREMKSFLGATAAGAGQAGFNTADHERKLADLTRQERELTAAIARAGGDSSYTAAERATNAVGAGFVEANRIAQEFDRQQAIAAARAKMEQLERDRLKAEQDYYKNVREGFWQNTVKDARPASASPSHRQAAMPRATNTRARKDDGALLEGASWRQSS